jgi:hypothetical protein
MSSSGRDSQDWSCFGSWSTLTRAHFWLFFGGVYKASHRLHVLSTSIYPVPAVQLSINMINILSELRVSLRLYFSYTQMSLRRREPSQPKYSAVHPIRYHSAQNVSN